MNLQAAPPGTAETIRKAVEILRDGGVLAVPTDTVYGLVALYDKREAVDRIFDIKGRPLDKPLPILLGSAAELPLVASTIPDSIWPVIGRFWPGSLTIVLKGHDYLPHALRSASGGVGVRVPAKPAVLDILEAVSLPLASTSANLSGEMPATTAAGVFEHLQGKVDMVVDDAATSSSGIASTVLDLTTTPALIRRRGSIKIGDIRSALGARVDLASDA